MLCGSPGDSQYYSWWNGQLRITLFPQFPNKLEMSVKVFSFYRVFHFGYEENGK